MKRIFFNIAIISLFLSLLPLFVTGFSTPAQAVNYTITYYANETQHQNGVVSGSVPSTSSHASGTSVIVAANTGSLTRQGFTFAGWNTQADGSGTTYAAGSSSITVNSNISLHAKWEIPSAARLIGNGGSIVSISGTGSVANGSNCASGGIRGIASDGTHIYYRPSGAPGYICKVTQAGVLVTAANIGATLAGISVDSLDLAYSSGCLFIRPNTSATSSIYCIDVSDWSITSKSLSNGGLYSGSTWLYGNIIDFPDGRVGAVSAPGTPTLATGSGAGQCPSGFYCKVLRLYSPTGTGKNISFSFSEDIVIADINSGWPADDHGIATDGTYLYQIYHANGYKVWALRSGAPSYLVFNGDGANTPCGASSGTSSTKCTITYPVTGLSSGGSMSNATFLGRSHSSGKYVMGDYGSMQFYISSAATPPPGPGTLDTITPTTSVSIASAYLTSGTSVSTVLTTSETLSSVTLYYSTSSNLSSPQSCGTTSSPTNGQTLTCSLPAVDATYYIYSRGIDLSENVESAPGNADASIIRDTTAPTLLSATLLASGTQIRAVFSESISATTSLASAFSVSDSGTSVTPSAISVTDTSTITLSLSSAIRTARTVTLSYTDPTVNNDSSALQDHAGNDAASFSNAAVTNNSTVLNPLSTPTTLAVSSIETNSATLTFTPTTNASSHTLRLYDLTTSTLISTTTSFSSGSSLAPLSPATQYYATLQAVGNGTIYESSSASSPVYFTTLIRKPVISLQPADTTTTVLSIALFALNATSPDAGSLSFQWQRSINSGVSYSNLSNIGGLIAGSTTTTLTLTNPALAQSGERYRAVVTTSKNGVSASETTTAAILSVTKANQATLSLPSSTITYGETLTLTATGGSGGGGLLYAVNSGNCTISTTTLSASTTGICLVTATKATDSTYFAESTTATITITTGSPTATITFSSTSFTFGITNTITVTTSTAGTVRFEANGRVIKSCASRPTISGASITATCSYKPATRRPLTITARLTPDDQGFATRVSTSATFFVARRTGGRG